MKILRTIRDYVWFIKESQYFMEGECHPVIIFILSLKKSIKFCKEMNKCYADMEEN